MIKSKSTSSHLVQVTLYSSGLSILPPENSAMLKSSTRVSSSPPPTTCPSPPPGASPTTLDLAKQERKQQRTKKPGRVKVLLCSDQKGFIVLIS